VELQKNRYSSPIVIGGFVGAGLAGLVSVSYIIEQLGLTQVASVRCQHIPPVVVFIGKKLRNPFRIYSDKAGKLVVVLCEVPINVEGLYETSSALLDWFERIGAREVVVLDSIPVSGIPESHEAYFVADETRFEEMNKTGMKSANSAMISGVGGSLLSECLNRRTTGISLLTEASSELPDPAAALTLIKTLNQLYGLGIQTKELEENVEQLNEQLNALGEQYRKLQEEASQGKEKGKQLTAYG